MLWAQLTMLGHMTPGHTCLSDPANKRTEPPVEGGFSEASVWQRTQNGALWPPAGQCDGSVSNNYLISFQRRPCLEASRCRTLLRSSPLTARRKVRRIRAPRRPISSQMRSRPAGCPEAGRWWSSLSSATSTCSTTWTGSPWQVRCCRGRLFTFTCLTQTGDNNEAMRAKIHVLVQCMRGSYFCNTCFWCQRCRWVKYEWSKWRLFCPPGVLPDIEHYFGISDTESGLLQTGKENSTPSSCSRTYVSWKERFLSIFSTNVAADKHDELLMVMVTCYLTERQTKEFVHVVVTAVSAPNLVLLL